MGQLIIKFSAQKNITSGYKKVRSKSIPKRKLKSDVRDSCRTKHDN